MIRRSLAPITLLVAAFVFILSLLASVPGLGAQGMDATPDAADTEPASAFPAHIHSGTCAELGDVVFPLNDLARVAEAPLDATPVDVIPTPEDMDEDATPAAMAEGRAVPVASSVTLVEASLDDILGDEHAINVHESPENIQNYIACGDLTGEATDGELQIQLEELNESGFIGEAHLVDNEDGTTTVTVTLMQAGTGSLAATPEN